MKKRIVAVLLSMAMVMTTGVGTVGAADFADETVAAETIDVQPEDSEISTDDSTEETSADDASVDLDTEDGTEDPECFHSSGQHWYFIILSEDKY